MVKIKNPIQHLKSSKGVTAIYVNKYFDSIERSYLNINYLECENTWIEIKNKRSKNIAIASIDFLSIY